MQQHRTCVLLERGTGKPSATPVTDSRQQNPTKAPVASGGSSGTSAVGLAKGLCQARATGAHVVAFLWAFSDCD